MMIRYFQALVSLLYPELCAGCKRSLYEHESLICTHCLYHLPITNFHLDPANAASKQLWGRVPLQVVSSYLYYVKGSTVQNILHHLKYFNKPEIGNMLGKRYGELLYCSTFRHVDLIVPVPLHPKKLKKRGYNQSEFFAKGLSESFKVPIETGNLIRHTRTESQTTKRRYERYENMKEIFEVLKPQTFQDKHILLVDDVLTTGATIEACAYKLLEIAGVRVSVVTLAYTK
ncbi:MAG: phosphoribosyltransferase family protein [Pseudosphingobacterium sp.]|jgi:ComF family protein|uniref:ComF family protein n=1 Tax=Olivibacter sp. 47 TaxID=3056486 RepID=UPI0025A4AF86|nr:phosphoribosyltransferase family protein [Olivibacter sp. 47]MDM8177288.1 phosphoribosyltransferase family protein [Olivibacter sp. 47]MDX3911996.1 phosphoribosyltransferase family protein [Pseudosphingobacterium sp.]